MTHWNNWEDWKAGFYALTYTPEHVAMSVDLLSDERLFRQIAFDMLHAWPSAANHNLKHLQSGHNAWIGQASCLFAHAAPSIATRVAWGMMTNHAQTRANVVAVKVREAWERKYEQTPLGI
jgi:hypothetical protein